MGGEKKKKKKKKKVNEPYVVYLKSDKGKRGEIKPNKTNKGFIYI